MHPKNASNQSLGSFDVPPDLWPEGADWTWFSHHAWGIGFDADWTVLDADPGF